MGEGTTAVIFIIVIAVLAAGFSSAYSSSTSATVIEETGDGIEGVSIEKSGMAEVIEVETARGAKIDRVVLLDEEGVRIGDTERIVSGETVTFSSGVSTVHPERFSIVAESANGSVMYRASFEKQTEWEVQW